MLEVRREKGKGAGEKLTMLKFQVTDCVKPLKAVKRRVEKGNRVCFGPGVGANFIWNKETGDKLMLRGNGRGDVWPEDFQAPHPQHGLNTYN